MRPTRAFIAAATVLVLAPWALAAQQPVTTNPHGDLQEPCASCHSASAWRPAQVSKKWKHAPKTFPLDGAHAQTNCRSCHVSLDFKGTPTKCAVCHKDVHQGELGSDCSLCHSPRNFIDRSVMVQRHQTTRFPLTGAHVMADCLSCHPPVAQGHMTFVGRQVQCYACHFTQYASTTNPPHQSNGFPVTCENCHTTVVWSMGGFNHAATGFALTGAHAAAACNKCHINNVFTGLHTDCYSCHTTDYANPANPVNHAAANFVPSACATCHNTVAWYPGQFDHSKTAFPLDGSHLTKATCKDCHASGVYVGLATTCVSCHLNDYNNPANPINHAAAAFPTTCKDCHNTTTFAGATFNHDQNFFPIYSGAHAGRWNNNCATCHTSTTSYAVFSCLNGCHGKTDTDSHHGGVGGYVYASPNCYSCHPRGTSN